MANSDVSAACFTGLWGAFPIEACIEKLFHTAVDGLRSWEIAWPIYIIIGILAITLRPRSARVSAPIVGTLWSWEPAFITGLRFLLYSQRVLNEGYKSYKDQAFIVRRLDTDIVVLSNKYLDELKSLPLSTLSTMESAAKTLGGKYTGFDKAPKSNIQTRALHRSILPNLSQLYYLLEEELDVVLRREMTQQKDWEALDCSNLMKTLASTLTSRILFGPRLCRNGEFIALTVSFMKNVFLIAYPIRFIPWVLSPLTWLFVRCNPAFYSLQSVATNIKRIVMPEVQQYRMNANKGNELEEDPTILQWMSINGKTDYETDSDAMAHRSVLLSVAASFTVADSLVFIFYDLCKHPEFIKELREEAEQCLISSGKWDRPTLDNMEKLESFMCESQRTNPSLLLTCRRRVMKPITLSDGLYLPRGTEIGMAAEEIANDPSVTPDPDKFDPFRSYRARQQPGEESKHRFSTTTANNLHFGYGTQACPGRQVALVVQKMVIASILIGWDIRYPESQLIPGGIIMDDMQIPRTGIKIEARRRKIAPGVPRVGILD